MRLRRLAEDVLNWTLITAIILLVLALVRLLVEWVKEITRPYVGNIDV